MAFEKKAAPKKSSGKEFSKKPAASNSGPIRTGVDPRQGGNGTGERGAGFLKIDPNSFVDVTILVEPEDIISTEQCAIWLEQGTGTSPSWVYIGKDDPSHDLGDSVQKRYRAYLPVMDEDGESKIFAMSKTAHQALLDIADVVSPLAGLNIRIKRTGNGLQTRYAILNRGTRMDISNVEEVDVVETLGPLDREGIEKLIAMRLNCPDYETVLDRYQGKKITQPQAGGDSRGRTAETTEQRKSKPKPRPMPVVEEDEDDDEDLDETELS